MRVTFYIPEEKTNIKYQFAELAEKNGVSYSKLICQYMEDYVEENSKSECEKLLTILKKSL